MFRAPRGPVQTTFGTSALLGSRQSQQTPSYFRGVSNSIYLLLPTGANTRHTLTAKAGHQDKKDTALALRISLLDVVPLVFRKWTCVDLSF